MGLLPLAAGPFGGRAPRINRLKAALGASFTDVGIRGADVLLRDVRLMPFSVCPTTPIDPSDFGVPLQRPIPDTEWKDMAHPNGSPEPVNPAEQDPNV